MSFKNICTNTFQIYACARTYLIGKNGILKQIFNHSCPFGIYAAQSMHKYS
jgi:hypothetical protein